MGCITGIGCFAGQNCRLPLTTMSKIHVMKSVNRKLSSVTCLPTPLHFTIIGSKSTKLANVWFLIQDITNNGNS